MCKQFIKLIAEKLGYFNVNLAQILKLFILIQNYVYRIKNYVILKDNASYPHVFLLPCILFGNIILLYIIKYYLNPLINILIVEKLPGIL